MHLLTITSLALLATTSSAQPAIDLAAKTTTTTPASPSATRLSPLHCGGLSPTINACPKGLVCAPTQPPHSYDFPGTCVLQTCGGKSPTISPCPTGQVCVYNATAPITDLPGRCMAAKLTCGEKGEEKCKSGWDCLLDPKLDYNYREEFGAKGICIPPGSLVVKMPWNGWGN